MDWNNRRRRLISGVCAAIVAGGMTVSIARADTPKRPEEHDIVDARLEGFRSANGNDGNNLNVTLDNGGTGLVYFLFVVLGAIGVAGMFKDARRSHLD